MRGSCDSGVNCYIVQSCKIIRNLQMNPKKFRKKISKKNCYRVKDYNLKSDEKKREQERVRENYIVYGKADMENNENGEKQVSFLYLFSTPAIRNRGFFQCFFVDFYFSATNTRKSQKEKSRRRRKKHSFYEVLFLLLIIICSHSIFLGSGTLIEYYRSPRPF